MSITVLFFAKVREQLGQDKIVLQDDYETVEALRQELVARGEPWSSALAENTLLVGVNHMIVPFSTAISAGDEVAFFPPVTGG